MKSPTIFRRLADSKFICIVRTTANRPVMRGTGCHHENTARQYADLLQRDIKRRAEAGDLLPPPPLRNRNHKVK